MIELGQTEEAMKKQSSLADVRASTRKAVLMRQQLLDLENETTQTGTFYFIFLTIFALLSI